MTSIGHNRSREILRLRPAIDATIHVRFAERIICPTRADKVMHGAAERVSPRVE